MRNSATVVGVGVLAAAISTGALSNVSTAQAPARPDLSGVWLGRGIQSLSPSDPQGRKRLGQEGDIPYTAWSIERMKATRPATGPDQTLKDTNDPSLRLADPNGYPRASIHPFRFKLVQTTDHVYQLWEYNQAWRQIKMNVPHSEDPGITWYGESVGKWEGDTLVVSVKGLHPSTWLDPIGHPHSEEMQITERIRRTDPDTLVFDLTFVDPVAYAKPWSSQLTFRLDKNGIMTENVYTIFDELRFREKFLGEKSFLPITRPQ
jgi:hypothetical protein